MWQALGVYFATIFGMMLAALPLGATTLIAVKSAPALAVALTGMLAAAIAAIIDHTFVRRTSRLGLLTRALKHPLFGRVEHAIKLAPGITTFAFASLPLPFVIVRVLVPLSGYPLARYALAVALGRFTRLIVIGTVGEVIEIPTKYLVALLIFGLTVGAIGALARHLGWIGKDEQAPTQAADPPADAPTAEKPAADAAPAGEARADEKRSEKPAS